MITEGDIVLIGSNQQHQNVFGLILQKNRENGSVMAALMKSGSRKSIGYRFEETIALHDLNAGYMDIDMIVDMQDIFTVAEKECVKIDSLSRSKLQAILQKYNAFFTRQSLPERVHKR